MYTVSLDVTPGATSEI